MLCDRRAKICATIGPATQSLEKITELVEAGVDVFRLNFSHGTHETHEKSIKNIREASTDLKAPVAILLDLQGPKIRVGILPHGPVELKIGQEVVLTNNLNTKSKTEIPVDVPEFCNACQEGNSIFIDDGLIELKVKEKKEDSLVVTVVNGGLVKDRKGVNIPGAKLPVEAITPEDYKDLDFGLEHGVDYIALSFVRSPDDVTKLKGYIAAKGSKAKVISKIEMYEAIEDLEAILEASDGAMVARGDLAVEVGQSNLPAIQKRVISLCNKIERPVITATQMLESMVENPRPTRAEITDVANAVLDGTDVLMLSAESAVGKHPVRCVETMSEVISAVESSGYFFYRRSVTDDLYDITESIAASACLTAQQLDAKAIVCLTTTGTTAGLISAYRPKAKIIAATQSTETLNSLQLNWGVQTIPVPEFKSSDEAVEHIERLLLEFEVVQPDDIVVLTMGMPVMEEGTTNSLRVCKVQKIDHTKWAKNNLPLRYR
jgi:pyruvate kinase